MTVVICPIGREVDVYVAIGRGREMATSLGFDDIDRTRIEIVILELTRNILAHAGKGELYLDTLEETGRRGMLVMVQDHGPGIADIALATGSNRFHGTAKSGRRLRTLIDCIPCVPAGPYQIGTACRAPMGRPQQ